MADRRMYEPLGFFEGLRRDVERIMGAVGASSPNPGHASGSQCSCHHPSYTCAELAGFRSVRRAVMERAWDAVREAERRGQIVTTRQFGDIVEREWERARDAARRCPLGNSIAEQL